MNIVRSVLIGAGAAAAVGGGLHIYLQQHELSRGRIPVTVSSEWNFATKKQLAAASQAPSPAARAQHLEEALATLVTANTDLHTKSQSWLAGYADLLRSLGLAYGSTQAAVEPLRAAQSIPWGNPMLMAQAQAALYELTNEEALLSTDFDIPAHFSSPEEIRSFSPLLYMRAQQRLAKGDLRKSLDEFLQLHEKINAAEDALCFKAKSSGYIAQILWKLGKTQDAQVWFAVGTKDAQCGTPACQETREMLAKLAARAQK